MEMTRIWAMPSKHTFTIEPISELLKKYVGDGSGWIDPFAGYNSPAEVKNDLNTEIPVECYMDALLFIEGIEESSCKGVLLDPPYSIHQVRECYKGIGYDQLRIKPTSMDYWASIKNNMARVMKYDGIAICCGWSSMGLGKNRGFEMIEVLLVPHGGSKNDTIVTVERKVGEFSGTFEKKSRTKRELTYEDKQAIVARLRAGKEKKRLEMEAQSEPSHHEEIVEEKVIILKPRRIR